MTAYIAEATFIVDALTEGNITRLSDNFAALDDLCPDLLDWTVGATLATGTVEIEFTIDAATMDAASERGIELVATAIGFAGGIIDGFDQRRDTRRLVELADAS